MTAKDEAGKPAIVPGLIVETRDETRRFQQAIKRRELQSRYRKQFDNARTILAVTDQMNLLEKERGRVV